MKKSPPLKVINALSIIFCVLTFAVSLGFALWNRGRAGAGFAFSPIILALPFFFYYKKEK